MGCLTGNPPIKCMVPSCKAQTGRFELLENGRWLESDSPVAEWLCTRHWALVPRYMKRRRTKLIRLWRKYNPSGKFWDYPGGSTERRRILRIETLIRRTWSRCVQIAAGEVEVEVEGLGAIDPGTAAELRGLGLL
jgi:hypothetical protein